MTWYRFDDIVVGWQGHFSTLNRLTLCQRIRSLKIVFTTNCFKTRKIVTLTCVIVMLSYYRPWSHLSCTTSFLGQLTLLIKTLGKRMASCREGSYFKTQKFALQIRGSFVLFRLIISLLNLLCLRGLEEIMFIFQLAEQKCIYNFVVWFRCVFYFLWANQ